MLLASGLVSLGGAVLGCQDNSGEGEDGAAPYDGPAFCGPDASGHACLIGFLSTKYVLQSTPTTKRLSVATPLPRARKTESPLKWRLSAEKLPHGPIGI